MELYQKNPEAMASIRAPIFEDKIVDFITEMATVTEKTVSSEQLMSPPEEAVDQPSDKPKKKPVKKFMSGKGSTGKGRASGTGIG